MAYHVRHSDLAEYDLDLILEWLLARDAGDTGWRWFVRLRQTIGSLSEMPKRCMLAPEDREFPFEVRQLLFGTKPNQYRILFTIDGDVVVVLHIRHGRRRRLGNAH